MEYIQSVSIPRSGHHLLVDCLSEYFKDFRYCAYYDCCMEVPCPNGCDFQKNHDFGEHDLSGRHLEPLINQGKHIVQYRASTQATFNSIFRNTYLKGLLGKGKNWWWHRTKKYTEYFEGDHIFDDYVVFIEKWTPYYDYFVQKWLCNKNRNPDCYFLEYLDFVNNPEHHLTEIVKFFGEEPDLNRIKQVVTDQKINLKHNLKDDPLYRVKFNAMFGLHDLELLSGLVHVYDRPDIGPMYCAPEKISEEVLREESKIQEDKTD